METREKFQILDIIGCNYAIEFYIRKPVTEEELKTLLFSQKRLKLLLKYWRGARVDEGVRLEIACTGQNPVPRVRIPPPPLM